jgi:hypothetical protein
MRPLRSMRKLVDEFQRLGYPSPVEFEESIGRA